MEYDSFLAALYGHHVMLFVCWLRCTELGYVSHDCFCLKYKNINKFTVVVLPHGSAAGNVAKPLQSPVVNNG
jgi:hypothetical protein